MTSIEAAVTPGGIFDEPLNLADCNPLLLQQLARQARENQQPIILRGCEVTIHGKAVSVAEGNVFAPGQWLGHSAARTIHLPAPPRQQLRIDTIVLKPFDTGPETRILHGVAAVVPMEPVIPVDAVRLASILIDPVVAPMLYTNHAALRADLEKQRRERKARQDACPHVGAHRVETTQLQDVRRIFTVTCPSCELTWTEGAGERCCTDTICYCRDRGATACG